MNKYIGRMVFMAACSFVAVAVACNLTHKPFDWLGWLIGLSLAYIIIGLLTKNAGE